MKKQKENNFLVHGGILAVASILVRFIGMIYRIPMVNIIGSEGNGYYSTAYSVYNILLLLSSYSMPLAVSKMVSARVATRRWKETERVLLVATVFAVVVGLVFGLLTYFGADFFCSTLMHSDKAAIALKWMAPTVFIMAVLGVLRGFFQGLQTTIPTAISQILEQIANALASIGFAALLFQYGKELSLVSGDPAYAAAWGAAGGTIGTGVGAVVALIFCVIVFFAYKKVFRKNVMLDRHKKVRPYQKLTKILVLTAVPVIFSTAAYNCIDIIDVAIFNGYMDHAGVATNTYTAIWGDYNSAFLLLIHLPVAFAAAIASALVPSLTAAFASGDQVQVRNKVALTIRVTLLISIPCAFGMIAIGGNLAKLLFSTIDTEAQKYLIVGGLAVIFYSLSTVTNAILQGLNHMQKPVLHALISLAVHTVLLFILLYVFNLGIYAVIISYIAFSLVMSILNLISIYKLIGYVPEPLRAIALPMAVSFVMVIVCLLLSFLISRFSSGRIGNLLIVVFGVGIGGLLYFAGILFTGCLNRGQLRKLPFGTKLEKFADRLHLLEKGKTSTRR